MISFRSRLPISFINFNIYFIQSRKLKGFKPANRKCLNCGKEFVFDSRKQSGKKYCNDKCGYEYNLKNRRKRKNSADNLKEIVTNKVKKILEQAKNTEPNIALGITISEFVLTSFTEKVQEEILERDGHRCYVCESDCEKLEIHHILKRRLGGSNNPENLITLCVKCHRAIETNSEEHALRVCYKKAKQVINGYKDPGLTNVEKINSLRFVLESTFDTLSGEEEFNKDELLLKTNEVLIQTE